MLLVLPSLNDFSDSRPPYREALMARLGTLFFILSLVSSTALAQDRLQSADVASSLTQPEVLAGTGSREMPKGSLRSQADRYARALALEFAQQQRGPMNRGFLWTGVSLLGAGALYTAVGLTLDEGETVCDYYQCLSIDEGVKTGVTVFGLALAGTGAALLIIGNAKRPVLNPDISFTPRRFYLGGTFRY
jgi:hypothetical protein